MRVALTALIFLLAIGSEAFAQSVDDLLKWVPGNTRSAITKFLKPERKPDTTKSVKAEWNKLPKAELDCINQKLRERGDNVDNLSRREIRPNDPRVDDIRNQCRASPVAAAPQDQFPSQPEQGHVESELRQTIEKLQSELANSDSKISQLEQSKTELERTIKQSEQERLGAEESKYEIEKVKNEDKTRFDAVLAQMNAEKAEAISKLHAWQLATYSSSAAFIALLIMSASVLFARWRTAKPVTYPALALQPKLLAPPTQPEDDAENSVTDADQASLADAGSTPEMQGRESAKHAQPEQRQTTEAEI
jgi:hypothetical protein